VNKYTHCKALLNLCKVKHSHYKLQETILDEGLRVKDGSEKPAAVMAMA
jgi:hypothetical protein